jgi:polysaccharide pyruvyl transferase WcaK-like protein
MKIVYAGDFRGLPNWGCRGTGAALAQLIATQHTIIDSIGLETLHWTGWHGYAKPPVIYRDMLPRRLFNYFWRTRDAHPRLADRYFRLLKFLGARFQFVSDSPDESLEQFDVARQSNSRLQQMYESISACDALVFNGEGTMIFSNPPEPDVLYTLFLIRLGVALKKRVFFLNAMFSDCPSTGRNDKVLASAAAVLSNCEVVVCRDRQSLEYLRAVAPAANITSIPDALFTWKSKVHAAAAAVGQSADSVLPFGLEYLLGELDFSSPYICVSGSSSSHLSRDRVSAYERVAVGLQSLGLPVYLICTCEFDSFLHEVGRRTGITVIPQSIPVMAGAGIVGRAALLVSGRFHPSIMASLGGTPCVFFGSNSHKTRSLQSVLRYAEVREFTHAPTPAEIPDIVDTAKNLLAEGMDARGRIEAVASERQLQAMEVLTVLSGRKVDAVL